MPDAQVTPPRPTGPRPPPRGPPRARPVGSPDPAPDGPWRSALAHAPVVVEGEPLQPVEGPLHGRAVQLEPGGDLGQRRLGGLAARLARRPAPFAAARRAGRRPRARRSPRAGRPAASTERWRLADSALITRFSSPRSVRATPARLELQQRGARSDTAEERGDGFRALPGDDAVAAPHPPRRGQTDVGQAPGEDGRLVHRHHELEVGAAGGQAQRTAGQEAAAQPRQPAVVGGERPFELVRRQAGTGAGRCRCFRGHGLRAARRAGRPPCPGRAGRTPGRRSRRAGRSRERDPRRPAPRAARQRGPGRCPTCRSATTRARPGPPSGGGGGRPRAPRPR